jgi:DNA-binding transcriptional regulator YiaG
MAVTPASDERVENARFSPRTLKRIRENFNLTQEELAELLEVSHASITSWETGKSRPRDANLARIITLRDDMSKEEVDDALGRTETVEAINPARIKAIREHRLGLTQADLAELLDVSVASIINWESGRTQPSSDNQHALRQLQHMSAEEVRRRLGHAPGGEPRERTPGTPTGEGAEFRRVRREKGLSQQEVADEFGVTGATISNWETGRTSPRDGALEQLKGMGESDEEEEQPEPMAAAPQA